MTARLSNFSAMLALGLACGFGSTWSTSARAAEPASDAKVEEARKHFGQGLKLYRDGDYDAALVQFERAYAIKPNYKVLYNIAQCHFELRQYVEARDALARYLKDGEGNVDPERKAAVESDLAELTRRIAHVLLQVNVEGATVYVDGKRAGVTPLSAPLDVSEGQRTISIEAADRGSKQRVVRVAGGEQQVIEVEFEAARSPTTSAVSSSSARDARPSRGLGAGFWVSGIGALALGAGAGVTGYLTLNAQSDRDEDLKRPGVTREELDDARQKTKNLAITTDLLAGGALVCAGIATVLFITHDSGESQVGLGVGPGKLELRGRF